MTTGDKPRSPGSASWLLAAVSLIAAVALSIALDVIVLDGGTQFDAPPLALLFNAIAILQAAVGAIIELRRPGHAIGRLLMLSGPLFAFLALGWTAGGAMRPTTDTRVVALLDWGVTVLSYPGMAVIAGWLPLLFPTGTLPGPRWRAPVVALLVVSSLSLAALATRPGPLGGGYDNPFGVGWWPPVLQVLVDTLLLQLLILFIMAVAALGYRYRRGGPVERHQVRWLLAAVCIVVIGFVGVAIESAVRAVHTDDGILVSTVLAFVGILAMPIAIGIAVLRYRLYEIDRIISRTIGWAVVTGLSIAVFAGVVVALSAALEGVTQGDTLAVAASTLVAASLFQPLRRQVQRAVDRRFDRVQYNAQRTNDAFAERLRDQVDLDAVARDLRATAGEVMTPRGVGLWLRGSGSGR